MHEFRKGCCKAVSIVFARAIVVLYRSGEGVRKRERHVVTVDSAPGAEILSRFSSFSFSLFPPGLWDKILKGGTWPAWAASKECRLQIRRDSTLNLWSNVTKNTSILKFSNRVTKRTTCARTCTCMFNQYYDYSRCIDCDSAVSTIMQVHIYIIRTVRNITEP